MDDPAAYEAWYETRRGAWIAAREFALMTKLLRPITPGSLLDVGAGTGHFSRLFSNAGLRVTGLDPDPVALGYARQLGDAVDYIEGDALALPFADNSFDYCSAVTSLCFVAEPEQALAEMWRVARRGVVLGLLNRHSLLYRQKVGHGAYRGARWDEISQVRRWVNRLVGVTSCRMGSAVFFPGASPLSRRLESLTPSRLLWGGFLAIAIGKSTGATVTHR